MEKINDDEIIHGSCDPEHLKPQAFWIQTGKYFTPSIEDIRVGYECEMSWNGKDWRPTILREQDFEPHSYYDHHEEKRTYRKVEFRTPYLTKEQIEAEGWMPRNEEKGKGEFRGSYEPYWEWRFYKDGRELYFRADVHLIQITLHTGLRTSYHGDCKDINTFRYICKLLRI